MKFLKFCSWVFGIALLIWIGNAFNVHLFFSPAYNPDALSRETFLFSNFTRELERRNWSSRHDRRPVMQDMSRTLMRLFPPGTDIGELEEFLKSVNRREVRLAGISVERRYTTEGSEYLRDQAKSGHRGQYYISEDLKLNLYKSSNGYNFIYYFLLNKNPWIFNIGTYIDEFFIYDRLIYYIDVTTNHRKITQISVDFGRGGAPWW